MKSNEQVEGKDDAEIVAKVEELLKAATELYKMVVTDNTEDSGEEQSFADAEAAARGRAV